MPRCPLLPPLACRARVDTAELAAALGEMQALASWAGRPVQPALLRAAPAATAPCRPALDRASPVAVATARSQSLASDDTAVTAAARLALAAPCELSDEDEELRASAASSAPAQPLPWAATAHAAAAALAAEAAAEDAVERTAPPRRSKKRCSLEAGGLPAMHALLAVHAARQEGEAGCRA